MRDGWEDTNLIEDALPVCEKTQEKYGEITTKSDCPRKWWKEGEKFEEVDKRRGRGGIIYLAGTAFRKETL